jgi:hypothetical protein
VAVVPRGPTSLAASPVNEAAFSEQELQQTVLAAKLMGKDPQYSKRLRWVHAAAAPAAEPMAGWGTRGPAGVGGCACVCGQRVCVVK